MVVRQGFISRVAADARMVTVGGRRILLRTTTRALPPPPSRRLPSLTVCWLAQQPGRGYHRTFSSHSQHRQSEHGDHSTHKATPPNEEAGPSIIYKMLEAAATSFASILVLGAGFTLAAFAYHKSYKYFVLQKMNNAFEPGDPVLELAAIGKSIPKFSKTAAATHWIQRPEQAAVNAIVAGEEAGHYHLFIGEKGTGKSSMLLEAMRKIDGDGCAMLEAHSDLEIFRIRLGKALDYEFHEDYMGSYFSERGPRDTTALLDIERALNKLEKVALKRRKRDGKPLVLIINQMHLIRDDEDGKDLIELLQQRAEQWAAANLVTMVFNSDEYWIYERLKQLSTRMSVLAVLDLPKQQATAALKNYRQRYFKEKPSDKMLEQIYDLVGGRLSFLNRVAKSEDMLKTCNDIIEVEKTWFLNQCWILGKDMDDDVMDQQKWASAAVVLATALVDKEAEMEKTYDAEHGHVLPSFALHEAQQIMTRADFIRQLDRLNLFSITSRAQVRASSVPMHLAFQQIVAQPGFRQHLQETIDRIAAIESLGRTRELVAKDLVFGGRYKIRKVPKEVDGGPGGFDVTLKEGKGWSANNSSTADIDEEEEEA
ncbi:hypothetical protein QBC37DRAFT_305822 [Rhypophila decipiens]|uniref:Orc1-like AAA ATPase domain-containing protein n=1 Tax=Rhypophila decipiens TaxID=261697 RepID=A0AAN7BEQ8_9PEZI|nr:hypothetical protein QBC37DRAFT_305822 [Rhypophila decipiens]